MTLSTTLASAPIESVQALSGASSGGGYSSTDAFQSALQAAGQALYANPEAVSRSLLDGVDGFRLRETSLRNAAQQVLASEGASSTSSTSSSSVAAMSPPADATATKSTGHDVQALQSAMRQSVGVMMETYSFALQATLVNNAATTFTSSVNTLIKTQ